MPVPPVSPKNPRCRRTERELRGYESEGAEVRVRDLVAVDPAMEGIYGDLVGKEVRALALLCFCLSASAIWESRFEARAFHVGEREQHSRVGRNGAATHNRGWHRRQRQEPHGAGLAVVGAVAIKAAFVERMSFDGQCERPLPPLLAPFGVALPERLVSRRIDERVSGRLRQGGPASTSVSIAARDTATSKAERNDEGLNCVCMVRPLIMGCHIVCINKLYAAGSLRIRNTIASLPMTTVASAGTYLLSTPVERGPNEERLIHRVPHDG